MSPSIALGGLIVNGKTIAVLATLDTKGTEAEYLCRQIEKLNNTALVIDTGVVGTPTSEADITRQQVAQAGGTSLKTLLESPTREVAAPIMADGATHLVIDLVTQGKVNGIISMGGTQGTTLATKVMRALPYGFPKVMVSTMASGNVAHWVGIKDITMMFSVTDILGLNPVMRKMLANAAASICGMANVDVELKQGDRPLVAVTTVGITTKGAMKAVEVLEAAGYETIVFHAVGSGGRAMEQMMKEGLIGAVLDYAIIEVSNEMHNALLAGGIERLTTAGKLGIPQVICPGAIEVLVFNEPETVPAKYKNRTLIPHSPQITDVRLNAAEMAEVGREVARRLNHTKNEAVFMNPIGGYDSYAVEGMGFYDPEADAAFMAELKANLTSTFRVIDRDTHIEDVAFATEASELLISLIEKNSRNML
ncbi:MAG: Tm-1-like ATP-binding domain-containing protein [Candidatus Poribacteria bacterium]|nr:Tm-1-like ATP-binding domain-containing protein [Candidatus Poribacteria bacterium]